jgi:hypothetical protein
MPTRVNKADMSMSPLGPPRNALLWLRAKEMAANLGRGASFQTVLQMYQMLSLAPGFGAVSKGSRPRMTLRRAKQAIGKSSAALDAAARINASPDWDAKMQRLTVSAPTAQRPAKLVGSLDEVLGGLPLPPKDAMGLRQGLEAILEGNLDAGQVMRYTHDACEDAGIDQPGIKKEVAQRMAYLVGMSKSLGAPTQIKTEKNMVNMTLAKAKYISRKQGSNGKYEYTYASNAGGPKTSLGLTSKAAGHAAKAEGHRVNAEMHAANGNHAAAKVSQAKADAHQEKSKQYAHMASMATRNKNSGSSERMASPAEMEHANRAPGGAKRMATASESGRLAMHSAASSPWDNQKSMKENFDMKKANEMDGINFGEASLSESAAPAQQNVDSVTELQQVIADFEAASVGGLQGVKVIEWALHDDSHPTGVEGVETTPVPVDLSANAPSLPFGQTISLTKGHDQAGVAQPFSPLMSTLQFYASQGR